MDMDLSQNNGTNMSMSNAHKQEDVVADPTKTSIKNIAFLFCVIFLGLCLAFMLGYSAANNNDNTDAQIQQRDSIIQALQARNNELSKTLSSLDTTLRIKREVVKEIEIRRKNVMQTVTQLPATSVVETFKQEYDAALNMR